MFVSSNLSHAQCTVSETFSRAEKRHNGGTLSQVTKRPKYHNGGNPRGLAAGHRPKFDEVDVRLLKNEMVLTQAQQAGLFNLLRTANRPTTAAAYGQSNQSKPSNNKTVTNHFHIAEMNVRDDHDIERIAAELKQMERSKARARGI
ncbi:hypothetical protein [Bacillus sp. AY3-1]|uniref:hypothetical protein n=1 Tax=Bacillus sp. AY3-1 TaxID=2217817 RepID=UPI0011EBFF53|nr:hypothetical protein [Bacillus sp. AY3-1]